MMMKKLKVIPRFALLIDGTGAYQQEIRTIQTRVKNREICVE